MRTKTLLLTAAAMAAGLATSIAQSNVYSANVVGYVNTTATAGQFAMWANPLDNGTNNLTSLLPSAPNGTVVELWNGVGFQSATKSFGSWSTNLTILPGTGFFIKFNANTTNTFAGSVAVPVGASVTNSLPAGLFELVGSPIPYSDNLTGTNLNLQLGNGSVIEIWTGTGFQSSTKSFGSWSTNLTILPGEGFYVKSSVATNWVQNFNLQ